MYKCKINQQFVNTLKKMTIVRNFLGRTIFQRMAEHGKQKSPRMFAYPSGAYAPAEQSAVRDMYVDPNRLVLTLT